MIVIIKSSLKSAIVGLLALLSEDNRVENLPDVNETHQRQMKALSESKAYLKSLLSVSDPRSHAFTPFATLTWRPCASSVTSLEFF